MFCCGKRIDHGLVPWPILGLGFYAVCFCLCFTARVVPTKPMIVNIVKAVIWNVRACSLFEVYILTASVRCVIGSHLLIACRNDGISSIG